MFFDNLDVNEVFDNYAKLMQEGGHLEKKANYVVPKSLLGDDKYTEVEIVDELRKLAAKGGSEKLYEIFSEDLMKDAHPEGSPKMVDAADDLGVVENLEDKHKAMLEVAQAKVKLASKVFALASELDGQGFVSLAKNLDHVAARLIEKKA